MESKEVGKEVALRLEIERQVREQLTNLENKIDVPPKNHWAWLESKLSLLLIGAVISGVLIPWFQLTQEKINWQRQNRYNMLERQLGSVHDSLKQFITVQAISAQLYDLGLELLDAVSDDHRNPGVEAWCKEFNTLKARRIQQNAAFAATVFYFPLGSRDLIRKVWNDQLLPAQKLELLVGNLLNKFTESPQQQKRPERSKNETAVQLDMCLAEINLAYEHVLTILRKQLQEVEHESAKFQ